MICTGASLTAVTSPRPDSDTRVAVGRPVLCAAYCTPSCSPVSARRRSLDELAVPGCQRWRLEPRSGAGTHPAIQVARCGPSGSSCVPAKPAAASARPPSAARLLELQRYATHRNHHRAGACVRARPVARRALTTLVLRAQFSRPSRTPLSTAERISSGQCSMTGAQVRACLCRLLCAHNADVAAPRFVRARISARLQCLYTVVRGRSKRRAPSVMRPVCMRLMTGARPSWWHAARER